MRPCSRAVVAGAGREGGRLPPSTLYMRVLALKVGPCLSRVANAHVAEIRDDQGVEQVGTLPLQKMPGPGQNNWAGAVGERHLAGGQKVGADDMVVHAVEDQCRHIDLLVEDRRLAHRTTVRQLI